MLTFLLLKTKLKEKAYITKQSKFFQLKSQSHMLSGTIGYSHHNHNCYPGQLVTLIKIKHIIRDNWLLSLQSHMLSGTIGYSHHNHNCYPGQLVTLIKIKHIIRDN